MSKVSIYTTHYNRPEFIALQYFQIKKHCLDDFEYIVINNAIDQEIKKQIHFLCLSLNLKEIDCIHSLIGDRAVMCSHDHIMCLEYIYKEFISKDISDARAVIDNDVIPFRSFSFINLVKDKQMAGMFLESYLPYCASIFTVFGKEIDLHNFEYNGKFGDSGAGTAVLIRDKGYSVNWVNHTAPLRNHESSYIFKNKLPESLPYNDDWGIQFMADNFIHFYRGTGWDNGDLLFYKNKYTFFTHFINNPELYNPILDNNVNYPKAHMDQWIWKDNYNLYKYEKLSNNSN